MHFMHSLGIGIGLRDEHFEEIQMTQPNIDWFEIISERFFEPNKKREEMLDWILERYPVVQHGVALAIGSSGPLDFDYLTKLKKLCRKTKTPWFSDHLCWGKVPGAHFHELLPLPCTQEVIDYIVPRIKMVQDFVEVPFALENISNMVSFNQSTMSEWDFYNEVVERADIYMMLDVNNVYVSSCNLEFDPFVFLKNISLERVIQIHLAGFKQKGDFIVDTHDDYVCDEVWKLYAEVYSRTKGVSTLLEWDQHFISFEKTWQEALKAKKYQTCLKNQLQKVC